MKTTGVFTTHRYPVKVSGYSKPVKLIFFGDVHWDSPQFAKEEWKEFLAYARKQKDAIFIGMGDYFDGYSTSERDALLRASLHDSTTINLEDIAREKVKALAKELSFMKGRLVGLINGNHYTTFKDGTTCDHKLCEALDCQFLGVSSFVRLELEAFGRRCNFDVWAHHGAGGGRLVGGSINRVDQMREVAVADAYVMGHSHDRAVIPAKPRLSLQNSSKSGLAVKAQQSWLIRSGSFLKAYTPGEASYNVDAGRGPSSLGHVELHLSLKEIKADGNRELLIDVKAVS